MKFVLRPLLYFALLVVAITFFLRFRGAFDQNVTASSLRGDSLPGEVSSTNENAAASATPNEAGVPVGATNDSSKITNAATLGDALAAKTPTNTPASGKSSQKPAQPSSPGVARPQSRSAAVTSLAIFILAILALGLLAAWDVTQFLGGRAGRSVMAEDYITPTDPDYELAEAEWAKGNHLDAINLMRDYLKRNPAEQHAAIRIAEIYEKDLNNFLAAALELEEVLGKKLPPEKWGWTAIHLANLYSGRLNQPQKAMGVLERILREHPSTAAAKKARQRMGLPEEAEEAPPADAQPATDPQSAPQNLENQNLPKGFRAKK
jgi:TolA-binding protein